MSSLTAQQRVFRRTFHATPSHGLNGLKAANSTRYQRQLSRTIQINPQGQSNLPKLKKPSTSLGRSSHLEHCLDELLSETILPSPQAGNGSLRSVKQFHLDAQYLKSISVTPQTIERIYQTLFVYSQGVNQVFKQLSQKLNSSVPEGRQALITLWNAYMKILSTSTECKNIFQLCEQDRMAQILALKKKNVELSQALAKSSTTYERQISALKAQTETLEGKLKAVKVETHVVEANLEFTDECFIEELKLRLAYQARMNSINISYLEIKGKYEDLYHNYDTNRSSFAMENNQKKQIINKLASAQINIGLLQEKICKLNAKLTQKDKFIEEVQQETVDLKNQVVGLQTKKKMLEDDIEQLQQHDKQLRSKTKELSEQLSRINSVLEETQVDCKKLQERLAREQLHNQELQRTLKQLEETSSEQRISFKRLKQQEEQKDIELKQLSSKFGLLEAAQTKMSQDMEKLTQDHQVATSTLASKMVLINQMTLNIDGMRAINYEYARKNETLELKANQAVSQYQSLVSRASKQIGEFSRMTMERDDLDRALLQEKQKHFDYVKTELVKQEQMQQALLKRDVTITQLQAASAKVEEELTKIKMENMTVRTQSEYKGKQLNEKEVSLTELESRQKQIRTAAQDLKAKLALSEEKLRRTEGAKAKVECELAALKSAHKGRQLEKSTETEAAQSQIVQLIAIVKQKAQHVHPFIMEDLQAQLSRALAELALAKINHSQFINIGKQLEASRSKIYSLERQNSTLQTSLAKSLKQYKALDQKLSATQASLGEKSTQAALLTKNLIESRDLCAQQKEKVKNAVQELNIVQNTLTKERATAQNKLDEIQGKVDSLKKTIQVLETPKPSLSNSCQTIDHKLRLVDSFVIFSSIEPNVNDQIHSPDEPEVLPYPPQDLHSQPANVLPRKIENKDFRRALRMTYMRK